jgi:hypothetical protein
MLHQPKSLKQVFGHERRKIRIIERNANAVIWAGVYLSEAQNPREKVRGATVHKAESKYQHY